MRYTLSLLVTLLGLVAFAQDPTPPSGLDAVELREWLKENWYEPWHIELSYTEAREEMYGNIDEQGGLVECAYSGFTQSAVFTSFPDPINTEHTIPQSWFNSQLPMRSDIHHLFPTHGDVNQARGSDPFGENVDTQTDEWFIGDGSGLSSFSSIPIVDTDLYSEAQFNEMFEPREQQKGNTARAVFYFYTMYPTQAGDVSQIGNLNTLYQWHLMDPPDVIEIERNERIQNVQGNYNPYISMPELAGLAWGFVSELEETEQIEFTIQPNPVSDVLLVRTKQTPTLMRILDAVGREVAQYTINEPSERLNLSNLDPGVYHLLVQPHNQVAAMRLIVE